jgi:carbohydrate-binding DOMON domain-containing protein
LRVEATSCASAVGGNITASNVSVVCGIPPEVLDVLVKSRTVALEELVSAHRETIALLKGNLDLNERDWLFEDGEVTHCTETAKRRINIAHRRSVGNPSRQIPQNGDRPHAT